MQHKKPELLISAPATANSTTFPLVNDIPAGFPSPATDFTQEAIDLNNMLVTHPAATYFVRVVGTSMKDIGIFSGDVLVVDRALDPKNNSIVIAVVDGSFTVKRLQKSGERLFLVPENGNFNKIEIRDGMDAEIWGVVTYIIHKPV
jgi:DNA polymerase V